MAQETTKDVTKEMRTNPKIRTLTIGIDELREVKVYPIPFGKELQYTQAITDAISMLANQALADIQVTIVVGIIIKLLQENLPSIAKDTIREASEEEVLLDMDNDQAEEYLTILYDVNYSSFVKKIPQLRDSLMNYLSEKNPEAEDPKKTKKK